MFESWVEKLYHSSESRPLGFTNQIVFTSSISHTAFFAGVKTESVRQLSRGAGALQSFLPAGDAWISSGTEFCGVWKQHQQDFWTLN
jgi:hypothetical protein